MSSGGNRGFPWLGGLDGVMSPPWPSKRAPQAAETIPVTRPVRRCIDGPPGENPQRRRGTCSDKRCYVSSHMSVMRKDNPEQFLDWRLRGSIPAVASDIPATGIMGGSRRDKVKVAPATNISAPRRPSPFRLPQGSAGTRLTPIPRPLWPLLDQPPLKPELASLPARKQVACKSCISSGSNIACVLQMPKVS